METRKHKPPGLAENMKDRRTNTESSGTITREDIANNREDRRKPRRVTTGLKGL